jgi:hypothetical protein
VNVRKVAKGLNDIGKALQLLSEGIMEGEKLTIDQSSVKGFAQEIMRAYHGMGEERAPSGGGDQTDVR